MCLDNGLYHEPIQIVSRASDAVHEHREQRALQCPCAEDRVPEIIAQRFFFVR